MNLMLIQCLTLFCTVLSIDIGSIYLRSFPYIENAVGVHNLTISERTPLSTQTTTWYILLNKGKEDTTVIGNGCPDNSTLCAITKVDLHNGKDPILIEMFSVDDERLAAHTYVHHRSFYMVNFNLIMEDWGNPTADFHLGMSCINDGVGDDYGQKESLELIHGSAGVSGHNRFVWKSEYFCNGTMSDEDFNVLYPVHKYKDNAGRGFGGAFGIIVLVVDIVLAVYLVSQAWIFRSKLESFK